MSIENSGEKSEEDVSITYIFKETKKNDSGVFLFSTNDKIMKESFDFLDKYSQDKSTVTELESSYDFIIIGEYSGKIDYEQTVILTPHDFQSQLFDDIKQEQKIYISLKEYPPSEETEIYIVGTITKKVENPKQIIIKFSKASEFTKELNDPDIKTKLNNLQISTDVQDENSKDANNSKEFFARLFNKDPSQGGAIMFSENAKSSKNEVSSEKKVKKSYTNKKKNQNKFTKKIKPSTKK